MSRLVLHGALLVDPEARGPELGALIVEDGHIAGRLGAGARLPEGASRVDLGGRELAPGLIDLHFHGAAVFARGRDIPHALRDDALFCARHGVTGFLVTTMAWEPGRLRSAVDCLAGAMTQTPMEAAAPIGIHLEGPWISSEALGAQPGSGARAFDAREGRELLERADGLVRMVTLAPEIEGAQALIAELVRRGIIASIGHSMASAEQARHGFACGVRHATHLFNAMRGMTHREPGAAGAVLAADEVSCDLISDGIHVDPDVVRIAARCKGERLMLISDRIRPPEAAASTSSFGSGGVREGDGAYRLPDGRLAGSSLMLDDAAERFARFSGATRADALASCTLHPARLLGIESERGTLRVGARADFAVFDRSGRVSQTWRDGRLIYDADHARMP